MWVVVPLCYTRKKVLWWSVEDESRSLTGWGKKLICSLWSECVWFHYKMSLFYKIDFCMCLLIWLSTTNSSLMAKKTPQKTKQKTVVVALSLVLQYFDFTQLRRLKAWTIWQYKLLRFLIHVYLYLYVSVHFNGLIMVQRKTSYTEIVTIYEKYGSGWKSGSLCLWQCCVHRRQFMTSKWVNWLFLTVSAAAECAVLFFYKWRMWKCYNVETSSEE